MNSDVELWASLKEEYLGPGLETQRQSQLSLLAFVGHLDGALVGVEE